MAGRRAPLGSLLGTLAVALAACGGGSDGNDIEVTSTAFADGQAIPEEYSCEGENVHPPLSWSGLPDGTASVALTIVDPDAPSGTFVHWVVTGLDPDSGGLQRGVVPEGAVQAQGSSENAAYVGPCPPAGDEPHRYVFTVHALGRELDVEEGAPADDAIAAIEDATVAKGRLTGTFDR